MTTLNERLHALYVALCAALPNDAITRTRGAETRKGYDTTGYGYQYIVDRMNDVLGIAGWRASATYEVSEHESGKGKAMFDATAHVRIEIGQLSEVGDTLVWQVFAMRDCIGGHASLVRADALKGAYTNGFKKTAALFGPGAQAYRGTIDDDDIPLPEGHEDRRRPDPAPRPQSAERRAAPLAPERTPRADAAPRNDGQRARIAARMKELARDPPEGLGSARCRELIGAAPLKTIAQRLTALDLLEAAWKRAGGAYTVDGFWLLVRRADLSEDDALADLRDTYGAAAPTELSALQLDDACKRLEHIVEAQERMHGPVEDDPMGDGN